MPHKEYCYAIVTDDNRVVEKFLQKLTAQTWLPKLKQMHKCNLRIINLKDDIKLNLEEENGKTRKRTP